MMFEKQHHNNQIRTLELDNILVHTRYTYSLKASSERDGEMANSDLTERSTALAASPDATDPSIIASAGFSLTHDVSCPMSFDMSVGCVSDRGEVSTMPLISLYLQHWDVLRC